MGTDESDEDVDVVALARRAAKAGKAAARDEGRDTTQEARDDAAQRRSIIDGVPQAIVDAAVEQMIAKGVRIDMRRIKKVSTGRFEVDLS
jgi:hypothetical protein